MRALIFKNIPKENTSISHLLNTDGINTFPNLQKNKADYNSSSLFSDEKLN